MRTPDWIMLAVLAVAYGYVFVMRRQFLAIITEWCVPDNALRWTSLTKTVVTLTFGKGHGLQPGDNIALGGFDPSGGVDPLPPLTATVTRSMPTAVECWQ